MRHGKKFNHLSRKSAHRKAMLSNMACSLIEHKRIKTTLAKAKALRVYIEPLITKSKNDTTHSRRIAFSYLKQKEAITELFSDIATKVSDRQGGYTRILKLSNRLGDNAQMALIELVDYNEEYTTNKPKKSKSRRTRKKNLDQSTITKSSTDNIIEDITSEEVIDVASSEKEEVNIDEKKSSDLKDESNKKTEKEVTDAENKEEKGE
ncbi:MAG: 50S ribosomal protein L17 [Flavobacteriales bacterium]|nr:50S ribosomal protein L17 [Flavobacteriales bacterium]MDG1933291.1 50S ribosomal protein L17 [Flavobacteriales bacterium]MDG2086605.1 50S ribosomal protein L17 [Flavobacteriales bacterium]|tara:strand:+ start:2919 stop:3539 length:621 start_codon:yes stop_codon:yes gene_type:complete